MAGVKGILEQLTHNFYAVFVINFDEFERECFCLWRFQ
jgi:hypothetical protein